MIRIIFYAIFILFAISCSDNKPEPKNTPAEYTRPGYADISNDAETTRIKLVDITQEAGIDFVHETGAFGKKWMPETMGSGGGFLDYNNDGRPDIFLVNGMPWRSRSRSSSSSSGRSRSSSRGKGGATPALYENLGNGMFRDVTKAAGFDFSVYGMGCTFGDYDSDGDTDIYLTAVGTNKLLRNEKGVFRDLTAAMGVSGNDPAEDATPAWSTSAAWLDYDRDGWIDLFVCNYVKWTPETDIFTTLDGKNKSYATPEQYRGETCRLYRNINGKRFEDVTAKAGVLNESGKSLGVAIADFNNDGWPDMVVSNDTQPNFLYMNNADGTFRDLGLQAGIAYDEVGRARAGMGIDVADISNNGKLSIAIGNFAREPISLYTQLEATQFQDRAGAARITRPSLLNLTFGVLFADLDLDGYQDLITANGHIEPAINGVQQDITFAQSPQVFLNNRAGHFVDITGQMDANFRRPIVARGIATADIDDDGDLDILLTVNGGAPKLFRNGLPAESTNWIKIKLLGMKPNRQAIGARVTVWAGGIKQQKTVRTGSSYLSQSDISELIFGLAAAPQTDSVHVRWPGSGKVAKLGQVTAGKTLIIHESQ